MVAVRIKWIPGLLILLALLGGCTAQIAAPSGGAAARHELIVLAAASLTEAFTELGEQFQSAHPGVTVLFSFAGSQQLAQQLAQGAPADVFASANQRQMTAAIDAGRVLTDSTQTFVNNRLVVIYPSDNPAGLASLHGLAQPGVKLVLAAPAVPVGEYSLNFLDKASATVEYGAAYSSTVLANVVSYEENVRGVLGKVALGEADAGIVYTSDIAAGSADQVGRMEIPDALNTIAVYPIAPVADTDHPDLAQAFVDLVLSPAGQAILARYGFVPVAQP